MSDIVREIFQQGIIGICYMPSNEMPADLLTKSLGRPSHNAHLETIDLTSTRIPLRGGVENNNMSLARHLYADGYLQKE